MIYKENYDLVFITTHQSNESIYKFLDSIVHNVDFELLVIILSQETKLDIAQYKDLMNINIIDIEKMSLSKARNIGLSFLKDREIDSKFVMFPDDDSVFDNAFFMYFKEFCDSDYSLIMPIYELDSYPKKLYLGRILKEGSMIPIHDHKLIGSPNQLIRYDFNKDILFFDECLGVGAEYGSCEDYDLFIRLNKSGEKFLYTSKLYNYHPKKTDAYNNLSLYKICDRFKKYSSGFCFIIFKYGFYGLIFNYLFRTLAASGYFLLRLDFKLAVAYFIQFFIRIELLISFRKIKF